MASFAAMAGLGAWLTWAKARRLASLLASSPAASAMTPAEAAACGHLHAPPAEILSGAATPRAWIATVVAAGSRPCSGAIILLVFALAQGMFFAGVLGVLAMAVGTALTTAALAALAVFFKQAALRLASGRGRAGLILVAAGETIVAAFICAIGAALALGFWAMAGLS
jgi:ABC-type nickel/cobalt efflux system permease component RcnA